MLNHYFPLMYVNLKVGGQAGSADPIETTTTQKSGNRVAWCHVLTSSLVPCHEMTPAILKGF